MTKPWNIGRCGERAEIKYPERFRMGRGSTYNDDFWCNARGGVVIGENTLLGPRVLIHSAEHVLQPLDVEQNANDEVSWCGGDRDRRIRDAAVTIGDDVWIGAGVMILAGSVIPDKCVIGAGCIITARNSARLCPGDVVVPDAPLRLLYNRADLERR